MEMPPSSTPDLAPSKPSPYDLNLCKKLASFGLTLLQIADVLGIHVSTLHAKKKEFPNLDDALKNGKKFADDHVEDSLYRRAIGYETTEIVTKFYHGNWVSAEIKKNYAPEVLACIFWLKNRKPSEWRDVHAVESRFVFEFVSRVGSTLNNLLPENCPHCKKALTLREATIKELERLSHELEITPAGRKS